MPSFPRHSEAIFAAEVKVKAVQQSPPIQYTNEKSSKSQSLKMNTSQGLPGFARQSEALLQAERQAKPIAQSPPIEYTNRRSTVRDFDVESIASSTVSREKEEAYARNQSMKAKLSKMLSR